MATKTEIPITSEKKDTEKKMAVVKQRTDTRVEADINNSPSTKSLLNIMIMNTGGKNVGAKPTDRRKRAIYDVVTNTHPALVLFQEFRWTSIRSRAWKGYNWPEHLQYTGHNDASILFDINEVTLEEYTQKLLDDTLRDLIRMGDIQQGFTPFPRMCLRKIKTKGVPIVEFICISWHGRHNEAKLEDLKEEFKSMLKYILKLSEKESLPVIVAGDYNVKIKNIETLVPPSLVLHKYKPSKRRAPENIIDFFISSISLVMSDINALTLKSETDVMGVLSLFDHDPVVSSMST
jgi:exonuclease III